MGPLCGNFTSYQFRLTNVRYRPNSPPRCQDIFHIPSPSLHIGVQAAMFFKISNIAPVLSWTESCVSSQESHFFQRNFKTAKLRHINVRHVVKDSVTSATLRLKLEESSCQVLYFHNVSVEYFVWNLLCKPFHRKIIFKKNVNNPSWIFESS